MQLEGKIFSTVLLSSGAQIVGLTATKKKNNNLINDHDPGGMMIATPLLNFVSFV